jgi:hypothetical protein
VVSVWVEAVRHAPNVIARIVLIPPGALAAVRLPVPACGAGRRLPRLSVDPTLGVCWRGGRRRLAGFGRARV